MEIIYSDGLIFSVAVFAISSTIVWIIALPLIIRDMIDERKRIKEAKDEGYRTITL
jgi:hypothetical protein